ncbi:MAG: LysR family transcriptional regulator [Deltaproteobacteria bacterium]|nr:LysR family transcriptional regulator [Deltaproteobacteria bacterium]
MRVHTKIWLEDDEGRLLVGEGRLKIFHAIASTGSMSAAARELGMSYRAVWGKIRTTEQRLGLSLVEGTAGGPKHGGAKLTDTAWEFLKCFETLNEAATEAVQKLADEIVPDQFPSEG